MIIFSCITYSRIFAVFALELWNRVPCLKNMHSDQNCKRGVAAAFSMIHSIIAPHQHSTADILVGYKQYFVSVRTATKHNHRYVVHVASYILHMVLRIYYLCYTISSFEHVCISCSDAQLQMLQTYKFPWIKLLLN